jgi:DNA-binding NtrC family response regulator
MTIQKKILIVDDERDVAELLDTVCKRDGHVTQLASNGYDALSVMENFTPDVIFLDLIMEKMDGLELIRALSKLNFKGHVIISSGYHSNFIDMAVDFCEASDIKSSQILEKPFSLSNINKCLAQIDNFNEIIDCNENFKLAACS